jgi:Protein of unknown function (DUF3187)
LPLVTRLPVVVALVLLLALLAGGVAAQGLPPYAPINPVADSRTPLGFEPYRLPRPRGWSVGLALDYASAVEYFQAEGASYVLDAELLRLRLRVARDVSSSMFLMADAAAQGSYAGFLDGFLNWYHDLLGITLEARELRPNNSFLYQLALPDGSVRTRRSSDLYFGDLHLAAGVRAGHHVQAIATVALPTSTAPVGYGRGVVGWGLETTVRAPVARPLVYEGGLGVGYTPAHGDLSDFQRTTFVSASSGMRWRFWGRQSLYGNVFYHSPYYHDTTIPALDRRELSFDFGWMLATKRGPEWRLGLTEDLEPSGPGIDLVFRLGMSR